MPTTIDFETRSKLSIKAGASKYAHFAEILCLSYSIGAEEEVYRWQPGDPEPSALFNSIANGDEIHAHNATFEINVWKTVMVKQYGWPEVPLEQWRCTAAECLALGLPQSLESAGEALNTEIKKDKAGRRVMLKMSKPRKPTKNNPAVWHEEEADFAKLMDYCDDDVRSEEAISRRVRRLSATEQQVYHYDQKVNARGVMIDRDMAESIVEVWRQYGERLNAELAEITFGAVTSADQVKVMTAMLNEMGVGIPGLAKDVVSEALTRTNVPPTARRMLEIRQELAKSSVAKYVRMLLCAEDDDRIRGCAQYHGAATGRWAGRLIQLQNLPRGKLDAKDIEWCVELVKRRDLDAVLLCSPLPIGDLLSSLLRSAIISRPGYKLIVCDFASVEARGLAWAADEEWMLQAFRDGADTYKVMAGEIYGIPPSEVNKTQRFYGKTATLGCFGPETKVLTDSGWKLITEIKLTDKLWDGIEWVSHAGVAFQGNKYCIEAHGVCATSDHLFLMQNGWQQWGAVATNHQSIATATRLANLQLSGFGKSYLHKGGQAITGMRLSALAEKVRSYGDQMSTLANQLAATVARKLHRTKSGIGSIVTPFQMTYTELGFLTDLQPPYQDAITRTTKPTKGTAEEGFASVKLGGTIGGLFSRISKRFKGGTTRILKWIEWITTRATNQETFDSFPRPTTHSISGQSGRCNERSTLSKKKLPTFDVLLAGPRNRFTIMSDQGPLVVHNCGYQLGGEGLQRNLLSQFGIETELSDCKRIVKAYRTKNRNISSFWDKIGDAALNAVRTGNPYRAGPFVMHVQDDWLKMRLPSGRDIAYYKPEIGPGRFGPCVWYTGVDDRGKPKRMSTYGGKLTENAIQALCRDLLVHAMSRLEKAGYEVIFHVHDEVVVEVPDNFGSTEDVERIMCETPHWAEGFPIGAEGFTSKRYRK